MCGEQSGFPAHIPVKDGCVIKISDFLQLETEDVFITLAENNLQICQTTKGLFDKLSWKITF